MIPAAQRRGFSMLELLVVVAITMVVAAIAMPGIVSAVNAYRLRTAASDVAGLMQRTRMQAVDDDRWYGVGNDGSRLFADLNNDNSRDENEFAVMLPGAISLQTAGGPTLTSMGLDFTPTTGLPRFNARGLPCTVNGGACLPAVSGGAEGWSGYAVYLRQERSLGDPGWAAITVSAAGRVRAWSWDGSAWK